jgi:multidrug resistance efflux pump
MSEEKDIELRSEEFQEVLSHVPPWIQRWGITLIFLLLCILLIGSYLFRYPEIVTAPIVVTTENLPAAVAAKTSGRIDSIFISEKQAVTKGQLLAEMENTARLEDVLALLSFLRKQETTFGVSQSPEKWGIAGQARNDTLFSGAVLGEIQPAYNAFQKALNDYVYYLNAGYHRKKIQGIEKSVVIQHSLLQKTQNQLNITKKQLESERKLFEIDSTLYQKKVIANVEFETARNRYLQNVQAYETAKIAMDNQKMSILQSEQTIFDLEQQRIEQNNTLSIALTGACDQLNAQVLQWEQSYLLVAPMDGTATFTKYWQRNQNVVTGETIISIVPTENQQIIGKIMLPPQGAGKVEVGQKVNVKLDNFPYIEYGMIKVEVKNRALVPVNQNNTRAYVLEVDFPQRLITTYNKDLPFTQEMSGTAEIITGDLSLLERLLNQIRAVVKK